MASSKVNLNYLPKIDRDLIGVLVETVEKTANIVFSTNIDEEVCVNCFDLNFPSDEDFGRLIDHLTLLREIVENGRRQLCSVR